MAQTFLLFDFGGNEESAQRARHTLEGWKQAFRLDKKVLLKFDREEEEKSEGKKGEGKKAEDENGRVRILVRLDFSDHERLSHQRWLERIPKEEHFKDAHPTIIRHGDPAFAATAERFDALD